MSTTALITEDAVIAKMFDADNLNYDSTLD